MLPNFLIVGAAKSGTSSLDYYLSQHPEIYIPRKKEAHYFSIPSFPIAFRGPGDEGMNEYTIRSRSDYEQLFSHVREEKAVGESSVFYLYYPGTAERIREEIPDAKILIILRNPVDRAFSAYMHLIRDEREHLPLDQALAAEASRKEMDYEPMWLYQELGFYSEQVQRYLEVFGPSQVKVVVFEDFIARPQAVLKDVFQFLNVDSEFTVDTSVRLNESGQVKSRWLYNFISKPNFLKEAVKPLFPSAVRERLGLKAKSMVLAKATMDPEVRAQLADTFAPEIAKLEVLLNLDLSKWKRYEGSHQDGSSENEQRSEGLRTDDAASGQ